MAEFAPKLGGRFEDDGLDTQGAGRGAVFGFVVDKERGGGREAGDLDRIAVEARRGLHLVQVSRAEEVAEVTAEIEGIEAVGIQFPALVVQGGDAITTGCLESGEDVEALGVENFALRADEGPEFGEGEVELRGRTVSRKKSSALARPRSQK